MKCTRSECKNKAHPLLRHAQNGFLYCVQCAKMIHKANPGLMPWPTKKQRQELIISLLNLRTERIKRYVAALRESLASSSEP